MGVKEGNCTPVKKKLNFRVTLHHKQVARSGLNDIDKFLFG